MHGNNGEHIQLKNIRNLSDLFLILWNFFPANELPIDKTFITTSNTSRNKWVKDTFSLFLQYLFLDQCFPVN